MSGPQPPDPRQALDRAAALCSRQERCSGDIREKLRQWGLSEPDAEQIIAVLIREQFVDDDRYARFYVRDKFRFNGWGRIKIRHALRQKGVNGDGIERALEELDAEAYEGTCRELIQQKNRSLRDENPYQRKGKLYRFAQSRGFENDLISRILNDVFP
ncbi:MAG: regulatory protein RecX [Bacteroidales bacterium]